MFEASKSLQYSAEGKKHMKTKEEICRDFGQRIKSLRKRRGLTQRDLAQRVGVHVSFLGDVERGYKGCGIETIVRIADALDVRIYELFPDEEHPEELLDFNFWYRVNSEKPLREVVNLVAHSFGKGTVAKQ